MKSAKYVFSVLTFVTSTFGYFSSAQAMADDNFDYASTEGKTWSGQDTLRNNTPCSLRIGPQRSDFAGRKSRDFSVTANGQTTTYSLQGPQSVTKGPDTTLDAGRTLFRFSFGQMSVEVTTTRDAPVRLIEYTLINNQGVGPVRSSYCQNLR